MGLTISIVVIAIIGIFMYLKVIQPMLSGKLTQGATEAYAEFNESRDRLLDEYYADRNRFGLFKQVIPDEQIVGIVNYAEPKKVGKSVAEGLKTSITGMKKVNVDMFYVILTDKNLHFIEFNGENSVDHTTFDLNEISDLTAGRVSAKDQMMGVDGSLVRLKFNYKENEYSYNAYKTMFGYPRFEPVKDVINGTWGVSYFHDAGNADRKTIMSKEGQIDALLKHSLYEGFTKGIADKFRINFPA